MLRLYVAEEEACLNLVLDTSASMELGSPAKWPRAQKLAAALGFLGLAAMDRVQAGAWDGSAHSPALRGMDDMGRLWQQLQSLSPSAAAAAGPERLTRLRWLRPGMTVLIGDFLTEGDWGSALSALRRRRQEVVLWQLLAPDEEAPALAGDLKLLDAEGDASRELTVTPALLDEYRQNLAAHRARLAAAARGAHGRFLHSTSGEELEGLMLAGLRTGVVRRG